MNFEEYLREYHIDNYGEGCDHYEQWLKNLPPKAFIEFADEYAVIQSDKAREHGNSEAKKAVIDYLETL